MRIGLGRVSLALGLVGLGVLHLIYRDFALVWQPIPNWVPGRAGIAILCGLVCLAGGLGLLWRRTLPAATAFVFAYLLLWFALLRIPALFTAPGVVVSWSGCGENGVMLAGALVLFVHYGLAAVRPTFLAGEQGTRAARVLLGISLVPCGLAHVAYLKETAGFIPTWIPGHLAWACATGIAFIAAGLAILLGIYARLAAVLVTAMMAGFTVLIWLVGVAMAPSDRFQWTGLLVSWTITAGSWVVAESYRGAVTQTFREVPT